MMVLRESYRTTGRTSSQPPMMLMLLLIGLLVGHGVHGWMVSPRSMVPSRAVSRDYSKGSWLSMSEATDMDDASSSSEEEEEDFTGKTVYFRTLYRLHAGAKVKDPDALMVEERRRFRPDKQGNLAPFGSPTLVLREGSNQDEIPPVFFQMDCDSGVSSNSVIATMLFLAANPQICQGSMLELGIADSMQGMASVLGAMGAGHTPQAESKTKSSDKDPPPVLTMTDEDSPVLDLFPPRLHHLTLSDEDPQALQQAYQVWKNQVHLPKEYVSFKELVWSRRVFYGRGAPLPHKFAYRTIVGCDLPFAYPSAKELARCVAHNLLPSNPQALAFVEAQNANDSTPSTISRGFLGMDEPEEPAATSTTPPPVDPATEVDPSIPPAFVHIAPTHGDEDSIYLRQFLERGFRMNVSTNYFKMEQLTFVYQVLEDGTDEEALEDLDLELADESIQSYQSMIAVHHPDYAGDGQGEYFFPMETGEYEQGSRSSSTYLETETDAM